MTGSSGQSGFLPGEKPVPVQRDGPRTIYRLPSTDLGNSSFLLADADRGEAVVVDPTRDVGRYVRLAEANSLRIHWVLDTHIHNDFLSGGRELATVSGASFGIGKGSGLSYPHHEFSPHETISWGGGRIVVLPSPGHTPEHVSYLLEDRRGAPWALFSGGSLMVGFASRPDLLGPEMTYPLVREEFRTLHERYRHLPGRLPVYPTHGGGSFCGTAGGDSYATTLSTERRENPLLRARSPSEFLQEYLHPAPFPAYYRRMKAWNQAGRPDLGLDLPMLRGLSPKEVEALGRKEDVTLIDVRSLRDFDRGHIPGSVSLPASGAFSAWAGWLRDPEQGFVIVDASERDRIRTQVGLLRIGYDRILGYLEGGIPAFQEAGGELRRIPAVGMARVRRALEAGEPCLVLDVRNPSEAVAQHVPGSLNIPLPELERRAREELDPRWDIYVHCEVGYRSGVATSLLERLGFSHLYHVQEGPGEWDAPRTERPRRRRH